MLFIVKRLGLFYKFPSELTTSQMQSPEKSPSDDEQQSYAPNHWATMQLGMDNGKLTPEQERHARNAREAFVD